MVYVPHSASASQNTALTTRTLFMRRIYHLVPAAAWEGWAKKTYEPASLRTEGYVHCSNENQVARVANLFYRNERQLLALVINADHLEALVRDEDLTGAGELFPHVYGAIPSDAVLASVPLTRNADNNWVFADDRGDPD
jgi:uncharacterized protein (DUF952 family)